MKAIICANGCSQRPYISKGDSSPPTVSTEALFITLAVDAREKRCVATYNIVRACLNADMDQFTTLKLEGDTVDLMVQVNPEKYVEHVRHEYEKRCYTLDC